MVALAIGAIIAAYLLGSISFAVIFSSAFLKKDVRKLGSGNAGTTNVLRVAGAVPGILTFVCDVLKGIISSYGGKLIFEYISKNNPSSIFSPTYGAYICGAACMIGHVFPLFFQFKGGKGIAASLGVYTVCCPPSAAIGLSVFIIIILFTKTVSLGSILATISVIITTFFFYDKTVSLVPIILMTVLMATLVILKHLDNIKRLIKGTESKIKIGRQK